MTGSRAVEVTRIYLEMRSPAELRPASPPELPLRVERLSASRPAAYRELYHEVGSAYHWRDRSAWSEERIGEHLAREAITVWVMFLAEAPAGWFELERHPDGSTEIVYFGLLPAAVGRGLGKQMLTAAVRMAWEGGAERVWLHTCSLDNPHALPNYVARGFRPFREERYTTVLDEGDEAGTA